MPASMPRPALIDIGANLTHESFSHDLADVLERAAGAGVGRLLVTGTSVAASQAALALAVRYPGRLYATAGMHPHHAAEFDEDAAAIFATLLRDPGVVAAGECGLDFCRNYAPHPSQRACFERQLVIAAAAGKPLFLHQREAHEDFLAMLREHWAGLHGGVAHCFTDGPAEIEAYLELGLHVGITGWICDERRSEALRAAVRHLPLDRVLLETDAPYLRPRDLPFRAPGRRNEPAWLPFVLATLARCMQVDAGELAAAATANAERLFRLDPATDQLLIS